MGWLAEVGAKFDAGTLYPSPKRASLRAKADSYCSGKVYFFPNQQGTSCILLNSVEPRLTTKLTCRYEAQRNSGQVERLVMWIRL